MKTICYIFAFLFCFNLLSCESESVTTKDEVRKETKKQVKKEVNEVDLIARLSKLIIPNPTHQDHREKNDIINYCIDKSLDVQQTPSGIFYEIQSEGEGKHPISTDKVLVHYRGTFFDGKTFDSSYARKKPLEFGLPDVIFGWQEAIKMLKPNGKGLFLIPSRLAYGAEGFPQGNIPSNTSLVFEIELLETK